MSTSIQISKETKERLELLKRDDETSEELLDRLTIARTEADIREMARGGGEQLESTMERARRSLNDSLEERTRE